MRAKPQRARIVQATSHLGAKVTRTLLHILRTWRPKPLKHCHARFGKAPVSLSTSHINSSLLQCHFQASRFEDSDSMIFSDGVVVGIVAQQKSTHQVAKLLTIRLAADATLHSHSLWLKKLLDSISIHCGLYVLL